MIFSRLLVEAANLQSLHFGIVFDGGLGAGGNVEK
jgi:hypothetical protein